MNTTQKKAAVDLPSDTEIVITRDFNAPRDLVWEAISKPEHVRHWWGLVDDSFKVLEMDHRVGGTYHFVIAGDPGGEDHSFSGEYLEIVEPSRVVTNDSYDNIPGATYRGVLTLEEADGITTMRSHLTYPSRDYRDGHIETGMEYGMNISYGRLDALLEKLA